MIKKNCIYPIDNLPCGEVGLSEFLSQRGYRILKDEEIYRGDVLVGRVTDGTNFSKGGTLELHVLNDPDLERIIDELRDNNDSSSDQPA